MAYGKIESTREYLVVYQDRQRVELEMTGATDAHNIICGNLFYVLYGRLDESPCRVYMNDMKRRIDSAKTCKNETSDWELTVFSGSEDLVTVYKGYNPPHRVKEDEPSYIMQ